MFPGSEHIALELVICQKRTICTIYVPCITVVQIDFCNSRDEIQLTSQFKRDHSVLYGLSIQSLVLSLFSNRLPSFHSLMITALVFTRHTITQSSDPDPSRSGRHEIYERAIRLLCIVCDELFSFQHRALLRETQYPHEICAL